MVIQRQFRIHPTNNVEIGAENSANVEASENSNGCYDFKKNQFGESGDYENIIRSLKDKVNGQNSSTVGAKKSLELLRANIQTAFDRELEGIIEKFKEKYFVPATRNIKDNLGENSLTEQDINETICKMLDCSAPFKNLSLKSTGYSLFDLSDSDSSSMDNVINSLPLFNNSAFEPSMFSNNNNTKSEKNQLGKRKNSGTEETVAIKKTNSEILHSTLTRPQTTPYAANRSPTITWNTSAINQETRFVFDFQANKLFNVVDLRDKITSKYPELIRYSPDNEDKDWLTSQLLISPLTRGGSFLLLVYDEVVKLIESNPKFQSLKIEYLQFFKVPDFIIKKMHKSFIELSIRNNGIRTNSGYFDTMTTVIPSLKSSTESKPLTKSTLSTSHATLSALLSSPSDNQDQ